ncbi:Predicted arabinose efflux permease, MFS family [Micromonospora matsumotoense]|uniref:Predicted arabinose efflux permease, MFS family n=1 Tax=Micromonospora matsumotoense TaxID=121616 RepID=A0A1C4ZQI9_9ACTN|nr:MFS transporter [Micromonospora matsumotoense]SCF35235.1 Predicted arabinose efflux permease, MFS family [Micromonospora matsumotoense]
MSQSTSRQQHPTAEEAVVTGPWWEGRTRQIAILIAAQALYLCSLSVDLTLSGLIGYKLAPNPALATVPFALITVGSACTTGLASALMARRGRRAGFLLGTGLAVVGGLVSVLSIHLNSFLLFCLGALCIGFFQGCAGYYRYAAADQVPAEYRARAISTVLTGGIIAAIAGPFIATALMDVTAHEYEGSYILVSVLAVMSMVVVLFFKDRSVVATPPAGQAQQAEQVEKAPEMLSRAAILRQPGFAAGAFGAGVGYFSMMVIMTVGPIAAMKTGHGPDERTIMIQLHMVGMYAPALMAGILIRKVGVGWLQLLGTALGIAGVVIGATGGSQFNFITALTLVGMSWSLLYISGSGLIATSYQAKDKARSQALGEALILGSSAIGGLSAASLLQFFGWSMVNVLMLVLLIACGAVTLAHRARSAAKTV